MTVQSFFCLLLLVTATSPSRQDQETRGKLFQMRLGARGEF